ncbi:MAG: ShlB/FhaC/HecB family hemolysin secretion/activation protein, partial [Marinomonas sp.]
IGFQDDRITTASLNFAGNANIGIGRIYGGIGVTQGLGVLGASEAGDPMNSRSNADGTFTKANAWVNTLIDIGDTFGLRLAANAQIASAPLLASEEMGLGGAYFGRGYDFSENYGDEGIIGLAEFRMGFSNVTDWLDWVQLYSFVDGGYVNHIGTGFGDGSLSSAGGGLRAQIGKFDLGAEVAKPISDDRFESGDKSPKVNMQVGVRF